MLLESRKQDERHCLQEGQERGRGGRETRKKEENEKEKEKEKEEEEEVACMQTKSK